GKQPLAVWSLAAGGASAPRRPSCWRCARNRSPACLRAAAPTGGRPLVVGPWLQSAWPWVASPIWGLATAGRPSTSSQRLL
ncbi:hypothetical protein B296_00050140, partial [Ensete ventricosum]